VLIVCGGIVTAADRATLRSLGIEGVFGPGTDTRDIVSFIRSRVSPTRRTALGEDRAP
jgi:methylmalonyl-CoA mutase C-terminal domain/subunit